jgi:hypothetical protein
MRTLKSPFFMDASVRSSIRSKSFGESSVAFSIPIPVVMTRWSSEETELSCAGTQAEKALTCESAALHPQQNADFRPMDEVGFSHAARATARGRNGRKRDEGTAAPRRTAVP